MKVSRIVIVVVMVLCIARFGRSFEQDVVLEVAVANLSPSTSSSANWGWWNPGKYDEWATDESSDLGLADLRLLVSGKTYTVLLAGEWYPTLEAVATTDLSFSQDPQVQDISLKTSAYDLGIGQWFGRDKRTGVMPWIGATYVRVSEKRTTVLPPESSSPDPEDNASSNLWGVVAGADGSIKVWSTLDVTGRFFLRWATGTRTAKISPEDPGSGSTVGTVEVSDSIDHLIWGIDVGLRWNASRRIRVEAGWRYRDRTYDGGPASFGGPQIKAGIQF